MREHHWQLTHGDAEQADDDLHRGEDVEQGPSLGPGGDQPVEGAQRQGAAEDVLEDDHAGEALDGQVACSRQLASPSNLF
jgi:hypothetical protein